MTIDHLERLGYSAHEFLGNARHDIPFEQTTLEQNIRPFPTTNEFAYKASTFAANSPQRLLHGVNAMEATLDRHIYGDTYLTSTPSIWSQQTVSLSISIAVAKHLTNARNRLTNMKRKPKYMEHRPICETEIPRPHTSTHFSQCLVRSITHHYFKNTKCYSPIAKCLFGSLQKPSSSYLKNPEVLLESSSRSDEQEELDPAS
jgi:hypothetical protein